MTDDKRSERKRPPRLSKEEREARRDWSVDRLSTRHDAVHHTPGDSRSDDFAQQVERPTLDVLVAELLAAAEEDSAVVDRSQNDPDEDARFEAALTDQHYYSAQSLERILKAFQKRTDALREIDRIRKQRDSKGSTHYGGCETAHPWCGVAAAIRFALADEEGPIANAK